MPRRVYTNLLKIMEVILKFSIMCIVSKEMLTLNSYLIKSI